MSDWIKINSNAIDKVQYFSKNLYVIFVGKTEIHLYIGVEQNTFDDFMNSPSKGQFFNRNIRGNYSHRIINL